MLFLILYGTFLGTEGEGYRWMRRYGVAFYFGFTYIGMIVVSGELHRHMRAGRRQRQVGNTMLALCAMLPLLGFVHVLLPLGLTSEAQRVALQNVAEWWAAALPRSSSCWRGRGASLVSRRRRRRHGG